MSVKAILILCAQALLVKSTLSQFAAPCGLAAPGLAYDGLGYGAGLAGIGLGYNGFGAGYAGLGYDGLYAPGLEFTATSGGALPVSSVSGIAPVGISVVSDNYYEGAVNVAGELPFVGAVAMEGVVPSAGAGAVNHACGNGVNAMISETAAYGSAGLGAGYGIGLGNLAYPAAGLAGGIASAGLGYAGGFGSNFGYAI